MGSPPGRTAADQLVIGTWNIRCSMCGEKMKFDEAVQHWQGQYRCKKCWEPRPAQDFVHSINSKEMSIPYTLKQADVDIQICTMNGRSAIPGYAMPGCWIPGNTQLMETLP